MLKKILSAISWHSWHYDDDDHRACSVCGRQQFKEDYYDSWGTAPWETVVIGDPAKHWSRKMNQNEASAPAALAATGKVLALPTHSDSKAPPT